MWLDTVGASEDTVGLSDLIISSSVGPASLYRLDDER